MFGYTRMFYLEAYQYAAEYQPTWYDMTARVVDKSQNLGSSKATLAERALQGREAKQRLLDKFNRSVASLAFK